MTAQCLCSDCLTPTTNKYIIGQYCHIKQQEKAFNMDVNNIEKKVWAYIKANNMLEDCSNAVVGVSGGADSVCLMIMLNDYITANVQFLDGTNHNMQYSYALYDPTICVSDIVVVKTGHHGFALAKVIEIAPESATAVQFGREIVSKVDFSAYTARQEKAKQLKELKQKMDAKVKVLQSTALYELLAEKDPELASMLTAYKELTKKEDMNHV